MGLMDKFIHYKYYDSPEGEDVLFKAFYLSKYAALTGFYAGTMDILYYSHPKGLVPAVGRYFFYIGPLVGIASAFALGTNITHTIRGKNDKVNYFVGGAMSGAVVGAWHRNPTIGFAAAILLGFGAMSKKLSLEEGWVFFPKVYHSTQNAISVRHDFTMTKDIDNLKNWTGPCK